MRSGIKLDDRFTSPYLIKVITKNLDNGLFKRILIEQGNKQNFITASLWSYKVLDLKVLFLARDHLECLEWNVQITG